MLVALSVQVAILMLQWIMLVMLRMVREQAEAYHGRRFYSGMDAVGCGMVN